MEARWLVLSLATEIKESSILGRVAVLLDLPFGSFVLEDGDRGS